MPCGLRGECTNVAYTSIIDMRGSMLPSKPHAKFTKLYDPSREQFRCQQVRMQASQ
jgi:hypothetical protein